MIQMVSNTAQAFCLPILKESVMRLKSCSQHFFLYKAVEMAISARIVQL